MEPALLLPEIHEQAEIALPPVELEDQPVVVGLVDLPYEHARQVELGEHEIYLPVVQGHPVSPRRSG